MERFTPTSLPEAVATLFRLNNYDVDGPVKIHGSEVDLVAKPVADPFAATVYIEVTVEYVDNTKYGKDLTKLIMVDKVNAGARKLIVSSSGFTPDVRERAHAAGIDTLTYVELFSKFEKFDPYVRMVTGEGELARDLRELERVYQPPRFSDAHGDDDAITWMDSWVGRSDARDSWLIVVGEYGTGKSALTRMLQSRWIKQYVDDPTAPIPLRIELGSFTRQIDAQGLLHHFLDRNRLGHIPIDFVWSLIRQQRVVLLLDGYDEMAQYLNLRERRATLQALAELTGDGARGLLTSRPNYFSETEELALFDHLYRGLEVRSSLAARYAEDIRKKEEAVDGLITRALLDRYERSLRDLTPDQARSLVTEMLAESPEAAATVLAILDKVFRSTEEGNAVALSGKPVIISYLIDVASTLTTTDAVQLSEWDVYALVVEQLGLRDLEQTNRVSVDERRRFLQSLALWLTATGAGVATESDFRALVEREYRSQLRRSSNRANDIESLFQDLRRSGTLTRDMTAEPSGWKFSHNSLREFLVAERLIEDIVKDRELAAEVPVSDAMRSFAASLDDSTVNGLIDRLAGAWLSKSGHPGIGNYLALLWNAGQKLAPSDDRTILQRVAGTPPRLDEVQLTRVGISSVGTPSDLANANFASSTLTEVDFAGGNLSNANFRHALLESVNLQARTLRKPTSRRRSSQTLVSPAPH